MDENELKKMVVDLQSNITEIKHALLGDQFRGEGLVKKVEKIEIKVETHNIYFKVGIVLLIVIGFIVGIFADFSKII